MTRRVTAGQQGRRLLVLVATVASIAAGQAQILLDLGQTPAAFAADSDASLRVAGFAFAIWGLIYLGLLIYAVRQVLPWTGESATIRRFGWPSLVALLGIGLWIVAAARDWEMATIVLIFGSWLALMVPLVAGADGIRALDRRDPDRWMTVWPLALLAGWLTIASPVNLLTVVTGNGDLPTALSPTTWAMLALAVVGLIALVTSRLIRSIAFALPIAWGLFGVFSAEQARGNEALSSYALGACVVVAVGSLFLALWPTARTRQTADA
jgi:hypothetical protein